MGLRHIDSHRQFRKQLKHICSNRLLTRSCFYICLFSAVVLISAGYNVMMMLTMMMMMISFWRDFVLYLPFERIGLFSLAFPSLRPRHWPPAPFWQFTHWCLPVWRSQTICASVSANRPSPSPIHASSQLQTLQVLYVTSTDSATLRKTADAQ